MAARGIFGFSLQHHPMLTHTITQVSRDDRLLDTARDCFHFVTKFFDVISTSATHISHSALELSPLSSTVRRLYYHQRPTPLPRVVVGVQDSWDQSITHSNKDNIYGSCAWSPCSLFVAMQTQDAVEIRDSLTFELLSTLTSSDDILVGPLVYSPDGRSLVCLSVTAIIIWDIQTGGVAKRIEWSHTHGCASLLWSLDGETIGIMTEEDTSFRALHTYCVASGVIRTLNRLRSRRNPHFWAHGETFRITTITWDSEVLIADTFEAGSTLTNVQSFSIQLRGAIIGIKSFSPSTNRVCVSTYNQRAILDLRSSRRLLSESGELHSDRFSPDGGLFAAFQNDTENVRVWKWTSGCYTPWREFPCQSRYGPNHPLLFSPDSSFILGLFYHILRVWRLSDHHSAPPDDRQQLTAISHDGTYIATAIKGHRTITIFNPLLPTPSQFIDAGAEIESLVITGNILLAMCPETIVAWRLTEEGMGSGVLGRSRADQTDGVWSLPRSHGGYHRPMFAVEGQIGAIEYDFLDPFVYHTGTGEVLHHVQAPPGHHWYDFEDAHTFWHHLKYYNLSYPPVFSKADWPISGTTLREGWIKDPEGKHRLWLPFKWRTYDGGWSCDIKTLWFDSPRGGPQIVIMF